MNGIKILIFRWINSIEMPCIRVEKYGTSRFMVTIVMLMFLNKVFAPHVLYFS